MCTMNEYVTIKEIAQAKGLKSTRSIRMEINKPESKYISREVKVNGGISYEILFSSLEPELQQKLRECETKSTAIVPLNYKPPKVVVHSPQKVNFNINAILYLYIDADENSVRQLVNEQLEKYKKELSSKLGKDIVPTQIIAILNSIYGVYKVELVTPAFQKLSKNQWASLENIEITIGERADE